MIKAVWVFPAPFIEPEGLLIQVSMQVERLYADIRPFDGSLEQGPEILNAVGRDVTPDVPLGMIDDLVSVVGLQALVANILIRVDFAPRHDTLVHFPVQIGPPGIRQDRGLDTALPGPLPTL